MTPRLPLRIASTLVHLVGAAGIATLLLNILGLVLPPPGKSLPESSAAVADYDFRTLSVREALDGFLQLEANLTSLTPEKRAIELFSLVKRSFLHGPAYTLMPWDNWLIWMHAVTSTDHFHREALRDTQVADLLWYRGRGLCHQAAWIFVEKARELQIPARLLRIPGHYLAEIKLPNRDWIVADPDIGIYWNKPYDEIAALSEDERISVIQAAGFTRAAAQPIARVFVPSATEGVRRKSHLYSRALLTQELVHLHYRWAASYLLIGVWAAVLSTLRFLTRQPH